MSEENAEEVRQLRESVASLTAQCAQLDEANRAWQLYHQAQADTLRTKLQEHLPIDESTPFDQIPEVIIDQMIRERHGADEKYHLLEKVNNDLRSGNRTHTIEWLMFLILLFSRIK